MSTQDAQVVTTNSLDGLVSDAEADAEVTAEQLELLQKLRDSVRIEPMAIEEEFVRMPGDLAYWVEQNARATRTYLACKAAHARTEGRLRKEERQKLLDSGVARPTESQVEAEVLASPEHEKSNDALIEAEVAVVRTKGVVEAMRTKRDMLIQVGAHLRAEMERDPVVRERRAANKFAREQGAGG